MSNIKIINGNVVDALLNGEINYLINQVNSQNKYASGLAKEIGERIPSAKQHYHKMCEVWMQRTGSVPLGQLFEKDGVIHLVGQKYYGYNKNRFTNYGAVASGFSNTFYLLQDWDDSGLSTNKVLGVPYGFGSGLGGGNWDIIMELIEHCLSPYWKEVRIYKL